MAPTPPDNARPSTGARATTAPDAPSPSSAASSFAAKTSQIEAPYPDPYPRYALGLLFVVYIVNFVDRQVLAILLQSIKLDLGLTDLQLGFLSGCHGHRMSMFWFDVACPECSPSAAHTDAGLFS